MATRTINVTPETSGFAGVAFSGEAVDLAFDPTDFGDASENAQVAIQYLWDSLTGLAESVLGPFQPEDSDLTAIAALSTTTFGRSLLASADAAALRTLAGLGSLATASTVTSAQITDGTIVDADINAAAAIAQSKVSGLTAALAGLQPLDSDLTAIAALTTTSFGRGLLALVDAAAARTALGLGTAATSATSAFATAAQGGLADSAVQSDGTITNVVKVTQAAYDLLTPDPTTVYFIVEP